METETGPHLAGQKTRRHEQCEADDHVTDNIYLECDPVYYNRYNEVAGLCHNSHHKHSGNHREGEMEQALPKSHWKPQRAETESKWMNGAITEQKCHQRWG